MKRNPLIAENNVGGIILRLLLTFVIYYGSMRVLVYAPIEPDVNALFLKLATAATIFGELMFQFAVRRNSVARKLPKEGYGNQKQTRRGIY